MNEQKGDYTWTAHTVDTQDGWQLSMFRIQADFTGIEEKDWPRPANNDPVIVMHDIAGDAQSLIESGAGDIDVLELVNRGHVVWMPNQRGTRYSNVHQRDGEF